MDLRAWIVSDLQGALARLQGGVLDRIAPERRIETVHGGGIAPLYVLWHMTRHHDLAVNRVLRDADEVLDRWTGAIGNGPDAWRGLSEGADTELVSVMDPDAVGRYAVATLEGTIAWVRDHAPLDQLEQVPDSAAALTSIGTPTDDFSWLYLMWESKPRSWFLSWEAIGHVHTHTGELVSLRNRMGLSPF